jgi:hypothetical protein
VAKWTESPDENGSHLTYTHVAGRPCRHGYSPICAPPAQRQIESRATVSGLTRSAPPSCRPAGCVRWVLGRPRKLVVHQPRGTQCCLWRFHDSPNASISHACSSLAARCPTLGYHPTSLVWFLALRSSESLHPSSGRNGLLTQTNMISYDGRALLAG